MPKKKKSRRRAPVGREEIYKLVPLRTVQGRSGEIEPTDPYYIQGRLEGHVIISISPTMSGHSASDLRDRLMDEFKQPVILVTHNIEFLKVYQIAGKEAREVRDRMIVQDEKPQLQPVADPGDQEQSDDALGDETKTDGLGDRPGVFDNGDSDTGEGEQGDPPGGPDGGDNPDEKDG